MSTEQERLNDAVDAFAETMKARLNLKRQQGWNGWDRTDRDVLSPKLLQKAAHGAVKGDAKSLVDVANLAMMMWRA